nr:MAG TPA: hypothetical protein [Bacteriophage sp.]
MICCRQSLVYGYIIIQFLLYFKCNYSNFCIFLFFTRKGGYVLWTMYN